MSVPIATAERILRSRFGAPAKTPTDYVIGFKTPLGRVLALQRTNTESNIWFQPPAPPEMDGVRLIAYAINSNLNGPLAPLAAASTLRAEIVTEGGLNRFLDWYSGPVTTAAAPSTVLVASAFPANFPNIFQRFQQLVTARDKGHAFSNFQEGLTAAWEDYKPKLWQLASQILAVDTWTEDSIGTGAILRHVVDAIEIDDRRRNLINNLLTWRNRWGHANRDHHVLIEAETNPKLRKEVERLLYDLYAGGGDEGTLFERLADLTGRKYPLLAYLFFLKDMDRFAPIQPTGFDRAFRAMDIEFSTRGQCSWENYSAFLEQLRQMIPLIEAQAGITSVRLVDAHSFCWIFSTLLKLESEGELTPVAGSTDEGRVLGSIDKSVIAMRMSVENTVKNSNGQTVQRVVKNKELRMTSQQLEAHLRELLVRQDNKCALTGIPLLLQGQQGDKNLLPSPDRIDSNGHYEAGNVQVVCQFINFWKGDADNEEFKRLLNLVRGMEAE